MCPVLEQSPLIHYINCMRDGYYFRSLAATLLVYCTVLSGVIYAVYRTGMTGFIVLLCIVIGCLSYFYGIFKKSEERREKE